MRAVVQSRYGGPEVLQWSEVDAPKVGERDVLVEVRASPVTYGDLRMRSANFPPLTRLPGLLALGVFGPRNRPGSMFAGRVVEVGAAVTRFRVGDDVFGSTIHRSYAELVVVRADGPLAHIPRGVSYAEAAATPYAAVTALVMLRRLGGLQPGHRVLVNGAGGGVGDLAVQVAKALGAHVTAVCSARSFARMRELGVDACVDYRTEDVTGSDQRWDIVLDTSGTLRFRRCRRILAPAGTFVPLDVAAGDLWHVLFSGVFGRKRAKVAVAMGDAALLDEVAGLLARDAIRPLVRATFPMDQIAAAHAEAERRGVDGAVVVTLTPAQPEPVANRVG